MALVEATDHVAFFDDGVLKKQLVSAFADRAASTTIKLLVRNGNSFVKKPWSDIRITAQDSTEQFLAFRSGAPILAKSAKLSEFTVHPDLRPPYADLNQLVLSEDGGALVYADGSIKIYDEREKQSLGQDQDWPAATWNSFRRTLPSGQSVFPRISPSSSLPTGGVLYSHEDLEGYFYLQNGNLYSWGDGVNYVWDFTSTDKYVPGSPIASNISFVEVHKDNGVGVSYIENGVAKFKGYYASFTGFGGNLFSETTGAQSPYGGQVAYAINNPSALFFSTYGSKDHVFAIANGQAYAAGLWQNRSNYSPSEDTSAWGTNHTGAYNSAGSANRNGNSIRAWINNFQPVGGLSGQITKISTSGEHFLALNSAGTVYAWGDNRYQEGGRDEGYFEALGERDGDTLETPRTIKVGNPATTLTDLPLCRDILALRHVSLAVDNSGDVWGWGVKNATAYNYYGGDLINGMSSAADYRYIYPTKLTYFPANVESITLANGSRDILIVKTTNNQIYILQQTTSTVLYSRSGGRHHFSEPFLHSGTTRWKIFRV